MLEQFLIFTRGGLILWAYRDIAKALRGTPVETLIKTCLLEDRGASSSFNYINSTGASYTLKWTFHNELRLVFVAVHRTILHLNYVDQLLSSVNSEFSTIFDKKQTSYRNFDDIFSKLLQDVDNDNNAKTSIAAATHSSSESSPPPPPPSSNNIVPSCEEYSNVTSNAIPLNGVSSKVTSDVVPAKVCSNVESNVATNNTTASELAFDVKKLQKLKKAGPKKGSQLPILPTRCPKKDEKNSKKALKKNRVWDDNITTPCSSPNLDYSDPPSSNGNENTTANLIHQHNKLSLMDLQEEENNDDAVDEEDTDSTSKLNKKGWFSSLIQSVVGKAIMEEEDLVEPLRKLKDCLTIKNVAEEVGDELCASVAASLVGTKLGSFSRISSTIKQAMEEALIRILTPKRSIDILRDIHSAKDQGRPYVVVFCGVNGVGKSTNLAKVAYWLTQHNLSVMMAACDTFRSGAVEQLRTHANRLNIRLFEQGYGKDAASVAQRAIREAARDKIDVVLVDSAGRMQDNEPLMRALAKLVHENNPDLVLFVGEALVGNDGVDQLMKFNQKLIDLSTSPTAPRTIDGILLTKFDTIDNKVGASLSMVYKSGAPIMFLGCGQTYTDLKKMNVKSIVKALLS